MKANPDKNNEQGVAADTQEQQPAEENAPEETAAAEATDEVTELREALEKAAAAAEENHERFLRLQAEFENYKKRIQKEHAETLKFAQQPLLNELTKVMDNLERAIEHARENPQQEAGSLLTGIEMVQKQIADTFEQFGLSRISAQGQPFDPNLHEAMTVVETDEVPDNHVAQEFQPGYMLHDRVVRPAMVSVAKRPAGSEQEQEAPPDGGDGGAQPS